MSTANAPMDIPDRPGSCPSRTRAASAPVDMRQHAGYCPGKSEKAFGIGWRCATGRALAVCTPAI